MESEQPIYTAVEDNSGINSPYDNPVDRVLMSLQRANDLQVLDLEQITIDPIDEVLLCLQCTTHEYSLGVVGNEDSIYRSWIYRRTKRLLTTIRTTGSWNISALTKSEWCEG